MIDLDSVIAEKQKTNQANPLDLDQVINNVRSPSEQPLEAASPYPKTSYDDVIKSSTEQHGVPYHIGYNLLKAESNFNPNATSPAGAKGIAQFMDATAEEQGVDSMDPNSAIPGSMKYLKAQYDRFGSWDKALAAYNAGGGNVSKYGGVPPFPETQEYVKKIMDGYVPEEEQLPVGMVDLDSMIADRQSPRASSTEVTTQPEQSLTDTLFPESSKKLLRESSPLDSAKMALSGFQQGMGVMEGLGQFQLGATSFVVGGIAGLIESTIGSVSSWFAKDGLKDPNITPERKAELTEQLLSPERIAEEAKKTREFLGKFVPKPTSALSSMVNKGVGDTLHKALGWTEGIEEYGVEKGYPNLGANTKFAVEMAVFAIAHKGTAPLVKRALKKSVNGFNKAMETGADPSGMANGMRDLMKDIDPNITKEVMVEKAKYEGEVINAERLALLKNQYDVALEKINEMPNGKEKRKQKNKLNNEYKIQQKRAEKSMKDYNDFVNQKDVSEITGESIFEREERRAVEGRNRVLEAQRNRDKDIADAGERMEGELADIERIDNRPEPNVPLSKSEMSQRGRGGGDAPVRPDLGIESISGTPELVPGKPGAKTTVESVPGESIPRNEFQINPETGKPEATFKAGERSAYQVGESGVKLVESVPGKKSVWQIFNNDRGSVSIEALSKVFGKAPKAASMLNQLIKKGISKQDLILSGLGSHLNELNQKKVDWKEFKKIADEGGFDVAKEVKTTHSPKGEDYLTQRQELIAQNPDVYTRTIPQQAAINRLESLAKEENKTVYGPEDNPSYNLPGHKKGSYKENLYKYEPQDINIPDWQEPHWGEDGENVMAHSRQHDRVVGDKDVVYVDELQSKWHMQGGKEGYNKKLEITDIIKIDKVPAGEKSVYTVKFKNGAEVDLFAKSKQEAKNKAHEQAQKDGVENTAGVPDAPFKKTWPQMIMRDVISDAIARNKDGVAWSTGKMQAERWGGKAQTKRDAIYDKTVVKFFKNELGVKPEKVVTSTDKNYSKIIEKFKELDNELATKPAKDRKLDIYAEKSVLRDQLARNSKEVWYAPITGKMRRLFGDGKVLDAIDNIFAPLRNQRGSIRIPTSRKAVETKISEPQRKQIRKYGMMAEKAGKTFKEFLSDTGLTPKEIHAMEKLHKFVKEENPIASKLEPVKHSKGDMTPFELKPGEKQVNITKGNGNKKIMIGESDAAAIFESPPGRKGLGSWLKPAEFMFDKYPKLRNLLDQAREVQSTIKNELEISSKHVDGLQKEFSNKKLREEVGAYWHSFSILGKDAMKQMGVEVNASPKYKELKTKLEPKFKDLFDRINIQRKKLGKRPIKETGDYLSFFAKESLWTDFKNLVKGEEAKGGYSNLVLDDLATIKQRQAGAVKDSPAFAHLKRTGLRKGVKLELDPLVIYSRYLNDSLRHIHMSPINAFVKELLTAELTDFKTGKTAVFAEVRPNVATELASWNNKIAGLDNMEVPRVFQKLLNKGMNNLTVAQLFGNLRTSFIQSTALFPTAVKHGYGATAKGIAEAVISRKNVPIEKSSALNTAAWDAAVADMGNAIAGTKYQKAKLKVVEGSAWLMKSIDYFAREATFRTVYNSLDPLVKKGKMTQKEAIRLADAEVIRTQGSGDAVELAPIQRNVIGKMATQWQTFTINHMNFVAKDVLGIKNPELKPAETAKRVLRYVAGGLAINALFEQGLGIQSPMPAPVQGIIRGLEAGDSSAAILLSTMMEVGEAFPGGGSIKFGSNPLGPLVKQSDDIVKALSGTTAFNKDMITKAMMGDERAMIALADILGKTLGVPGTAQATKFARGQRRGESIPRSLIGRIYTEPKKKSGSSSSLKGLSGLKGLKGLKGL